MKVNNKKIKSESASIENVKRFFLNSPNDDIVSINDAFRAWGRDLDKEEKNKAWLSNVISPLKYHDLITPIYSFNSGRKKLDKLQLTFKGKKVLGRIGRENETENGTTPPTNINSLSIADVMKIVAKLRKENPEYEINFDVKLKNL